MTFYVQGLSGHEVMPLTHLFDQGLVEKTRRIDAENRIDPARKRTDETQDHRQAGIALQVYHEIDQFQPEEPVLFAEQVMTSPVISSGSHDSIADAIKLFRSQHIRHLPIVTNKGVVEGIISDRDILRYLSGVTEDYKQFISSAKPNDQIRGLMRTRVLTASTDTDVRYIARLFVEQRVGAMPIVVEGNLKGIITRSDLLAAVMRHFILELWA